MTEPHPARRWHGPAAAALAALLFGLSACGDDPFDFDWTNTPGTRDTVLLYSLARPELGLPSGMTFRPRPEQAVIEAPNATGSWDVALDTQGGQLVLLPPGALGVLSRARIAHLGPVDFDELLEAPEDTLVYVADAPVAVVDGTVYVIRTGRSPGTFGTSCVYYAKLEPITIDVPGGTLLFRYVASPICNSRELVYRN